MNIYITSGTLDYLKGIENKYPTETIVTMVNENGALLLHETIEASVFKEPRKYEVIDSEGIINKEGYVVINYIPVTEEGRPLFEHQFKWRQSLVETEPGFIAIRVLRPFSSNTYIILTIWESEIAFQSCHNFKAFLETYSKGSEKGIDSQLKIFTSGAYASKYTITGE